MGTFEVRNDVRTQIKFDANMMNKSIKLNAITMKLKTAITNFDNNCRWICVKNKFTADDKMYNRWDKIKCEIINETIDNNRQDLQD